MGNLGGNVRQIQSRGAIVCLNFCSNADIQKLYTRWGWKQHEITGVQAEHAKMQSDCLCIQLHKSRSLRAQMIH